MYILAAITTFVQNVNKVYGKKWTNQSQQSLLKEITHAGSRKNADKFIFLLQLGSHHHAFLIFVNIIVQKTNFGAGFVFERVRSTLLSTLKCFNGGKKA